MFIYIYVLLCFQLFGDYNAEGVWKVGLLSKIIKDSHDKVGAAKGSINHWEDNKRPNKPAEDPPTVIREWIIMDGSLDPAWVDSMSTLLDEGRELSLASGAHVKLNGT